MTSRRTAGFAVALLLASVISAASARAADQKNLYEQLEASSNFTVLLTAVKEANLVSLLDGKGPNTFLAPTDEAFKKLGDEQIKRIVADRELVKKIVLAHVVKGEEIKGNQFKTMSVKEWNGFPITVGDGVKVGDARITMFDNRCSNGIVHTIDTVLIPK
jgi:uncharacterized surface protein with fasciclin (FAS1) repeats